MKINDLYELLRKKFNEINLKITNLRNSEHEFQHFLESVPDFFLKRQGTIASSNEARLILNAYPYSKKPEDQLTVEVLQSILSLLETNKTITRIDIPRYHLNEEQRQLTQKIQDALIPEARELQKNNSGFGLR